MSTLAPHSAPHSAHNLRASDAREVVPCAHCTLPVPPGRVVVEGQSAGDGVDACRGAGLHFCCDGCATVFAILHAHDLDAYYALRDEEERAPARATSHAYREYDDPAFWERFVDEGEGVASMECYLEGVHCAACLWLVERLPQVADGVIEARLDFARSTARVTWDPEAIELSSVARWLDRLGYPPHPTKATTVRDARRREDRRMFIRLAVAGACAGNIMLMSFALYSGAFFGMAAAYERFFRWGSMLLALPAVFWAGRPFLQGAWGAVRTRTAHMDMPIALGILVGLASGVANTLRGAGEVYFDSVATLIFFLLVGRWLQQRQQRKAADAAELRHALTPLHARRVDGDTIVDIPVMAIAAADLLEVRPGESFPADGVLASEQASVDQSVLTGEARPVTLREGDPVHAGTLNLEAVVRLRAEVTGVETRVGQLMAAVEEAGQRRAPVVQLADRISGVFVVAVVILAAAVFVGWRLVDPAQALDRTIALLIVSCPCALGMATPLAIAAGLGRAARRGILVKGGDVFERLVQPRRFVFDKTGTLTEGGLHVVAWHDAPGADGARSRAVVAGLERDATHPIARALRAVAEPAAVDPSLVEHALGEGVAASLHDGRWRVGAPISDDYGATPWVEGHVAAIASTGASPILVSRDGEAMAVVGVGDNLRADAAASLAQLRAWGHEVEILSGDHPATVAAVARALGVERARGAASPEDKLAAVAHEGAVMVGDGVNDAAAMSAASVGIAVQGGAEASLAAADVFVTREGIGPVVELVAGARRVLAVVRRNLAFSLLYNLATVTLAATGVIGPLGAAVLMPLSSLTVVASSYQARTFPEPASGSAT